MMPVSPAPQGFCIEIKATAGPSESSNLILGALIFTSTTLGGFLIMIMV